MITIYYVRHGQTDYNKNMILTGNADVSLNDEGIKQAEETAILLKDKTFDIAFRSPLLRAVQTSDIINKYHKLIFINDGRLKERDYGPYAGLDVDKINREISWNFYFDSKTYKNIESVKNLYKRVKEFLDYIRENFENKNILIVAHSGVGRAVDCYFNGIPQDGNLLNKNTNNAEFKIYKMI